LAQDIQLGFHRDTGKFVSDVPDHLEILRGHVGISGNGYDVMKLAPSRDSTVRMLNFCMLDVKGSRDSDMLGLRKLKAHPWLRDWAGFE